MSPPHEFAADPFEEIFQTAMDEAVAVREPGEAGKKVYLEALHRWIEDIESAIEEAESA